MIKLTLVASALLVLALQGVTCGSTGGEADRESCFEAAGKFLASLKLSENILKLVAALKEAQPNFMILSKDGELRHAYHRGYVPNEEIFAECDHLLDIIDGPDADLPDCFDDIAIKDRYFEDLAAANPDGRPVVEGLAACYINNYLVFTEEREQKELAEIGHCLAEVGKSFDSHEVPDDVVQLVNALRADTPDILSIPVKARKERSDFRKFHPIKPQPAGCYEVFDLFDEVMAKVTCFEDIAPKIHYLASANPELEPMVEALLACYTNYDLLGPRIEG